MIEFFKNIPTFSELFNQIVNIIKTNQFAQGGVLISFLMSIPRYILPYFITLYERIKRLVVYTVHIEETDDLFLYLEKWLSINHKSKYRNVEASLKLDKNDDTNYDVYTEVFIEKKDEKVHFKQFEDLFFIHRGINFLRVYKGREKMEGARSNRNAYYNKYSISGIFAKKTIDKLIKEVHAHALSLIESRKVKKVEVFVSDKHGSWEKINTLTPKNMDDIILDGKDDLIDDINKFLLNKTWYEDRHIGYKRGYLFMGGAGMGKTSLVLSLSKLFKRSVYFLNLSGMDDEGVRFAFQDIDPSSFMIIEDIDSIFTKRDGQDDVKFSFSTLLNCMDGVFSVDNIITIFTTNHPEKLDHALLRCGRIDFKMEFNRLDNKNLKLFMRRFYQSDNIDWSYEYNGMLATSDIQDICLRNKNDSEMALIEIIRKDKFYFDKNMNANDIYLENKKSDIIVDVE